MAVNKLHWNLFGAAQEYKINILYTRKSWVLSPETSVSGAREFHLGILCQSFMAGGAYYAMGTSNKTWIYFT